MPRGIKIVDPLALKASRPKDIVIVGYGQRQGNNLRQEDSISLFSTECVALSAGLGGMPHGDIASKLATETAIWGYKHIRLRPYYWADKKLFMKRIFRSVNIAVWQKHRETGFSDGMGSALTVLMIGSRTIWVGNVGDNVGLFLHNETVVPLTGQARPSGGSPSNAVGLLRYGLLPQYITRSFEIGDCVILLTDGVSNIVQNEEVFIQISKAKTIHELQYGIDSVLQVAIKRGGTGNMTVCAVKRIAVDRDRFR